MLGSIKTPEEQGDETPREDSTTIALVRSASLELGVLQELQDALAAATGVSWELVDPTGVPMTRTSGERRLCALVRATPEENERCLIVSQQAGKQAVAANGPLQTRCEVCELAFIAAPVIVGGQHVATMHCGTTRTGEMSPETLQRLADSFGLGQEAIAALHEAMPCLEASELRTIATLAEQLCRNFAGQEQVSARRREVRDLSEQVCRNFAEQEQKHLAVLQDVAQNRNADWFLNGIINALPDPVFVKDRAHRWLLLNDAFCRFVRRPREQLVGRTDFDFFPTQEARIFWQQDDVVFETGVENINEEYLTDSSGTTHFISTKKTRFVKQGGQQCLVGVVRDITLQRKDEQELARHRWHLEDVVTARTQELLDANRKLQREIDGHRRAEEGRLKAEAQVMHQQKLEAIGRLAGGVAHDFNNLLTGIFGHVSLALREVPKEGRAFESLSEIRNAARRATDLTKQLLMFSRKQVIAPRDVDLNELLSNLQKLLVRIIGEDVRLETDLQAKLPTIHVDAGQIEQVVVNLAVNARDAMPQGGTLVLSTRYVKVPPIPNTGARSGKRRGCVALTVRDTGVGMDTATRERIFEPFFTTKEGGTGLGLATVFGIVQRHEGFIDFSSTPGRGSTFTAYLPVVNAVAEPAFRAPISTRLPVGTETLLIVEDDAMVRDVAHAMLTELGYQVLLAPDGVSALELSKLLSSTIHLLITDVVMPGMDGLELARKLRETREGLRVIFMSGYTDNVLDHHGVNMGHADFLAKPFSRETLATRIREALDRP